MAVFKVLWRRVEALQQGKVDVILVRLEEVSPSLQHAKPWHCEQTAFVPKVLSKSTIPMTARELAELPWAVLKARLDKAFRRGR